MNANRQSEFGISNSNMIYFIYFCFDKINSPGHRTCKQVHPGSSSMYVFVRPASLMSRNRSDHGSWTLVMIAMVIGIIQDTCRSRARFSVIASRWQAFKRSMVWRYMLVIESAIPVNTHAITSGSPTYDSWWLPYLDCHDWLVKVRFHYISISQLSSLIIYLPSPIPLPAHSMWERDRDTYARTPVRIHYIIIWGFRAHCLGPWSFNLRALVFNNILCSIMCRPSCHLWPVFVNQL
jgi:hypothetical protein